MHVNLYVNMTSIIMLYIAITEVGKYVADFINIRMTDKKWIHFHTDYENADNECEDCSNTHLVKKKKVLLIFLTINAHNSKLILYLCVYFF